MSSVRRVATLVSGGSHSMSSVRRFGASGTDLVLAQVADDLEMTRRDSMEGGWHVGVALPVGEQSLAGHTRDGRPRGDFILPL